jgi:hypothetical protein
MGRLARELVADADGAAVVVGRMLAWGARRGWGVCVAIFVVISVAVAIVVAGRCGGVARRTLGSCGSGSRGASGNQKHEQESDWKER